MGQRPGLWTTALQQARSRAEQGGLELTSYYFANALWHCPGNWRIISDYADAVLAWAKDVARRDVSSGSPSALDVVNELHAFLREQTAMVHPDRLPELLKKTADRRGRQEGHKQGA